MPLLHSCRLHFCSRRGLRKLRAQMKLTLVRGAFSVILAATMLFAYTQLNRITRISSDEAPALNVMKAFLDWRRCMVQQLEHYIGKPEKFFKNFDKMTADCTSSTDVRKIKLLPLRNDDEVKYYIMSSHTTDPSVVISLGVGADTRVEHYLKTVLPWRSEFFGADPVVSPNDRLYGLIGTFFPVAVSKSAGNSRSNVRLDNGKYKMVVVKHVDAVTFFTEMVNRSHIDHIIMDNEGPEYDLVPLIAIDGNLTEHGISVCHMNVEFHRPGPASRYEAFLDVMWGVLRTGRFAPLYTKYAGHQRMFLVNYEDPFCVNKYLEQFF